MIFENRFIYYPTRDFWVEPDEFGLDFENIWFEASDGVKLHGWLIPKDKAQSALLFFHGNAGNISDRLDNIIKLHHQVGSEIFIFDYRGYGRSNGKPDEAGLCRDGAAALNWLNERCRPKKIKTILFGRSLGGAVAIDAASKMKCDALIVESTFTSIPAVAAALIPIAPRSLIKTKFDSLNKIEAVSVPKLFIHGDSDSLIPVSHCRRLFEKASEPKRIYIVHGADHNDAYIEGGERYFKEFKDFIAGIESS